MSKTLLMGNEAIALGALRAGVRVVTGYPGTPSTEVLETVARQNDGKVYVEWSVNEKAALEVAAGAAYSGARAMVTMKQVGLNVASDPLMSLNYVGVKGGLVVVVADDPGPISSQTEQDTRHFGQYAKLMVFDPATPEEAYLMAADAFAWSERYGRPVILRPTTRVCHACASVETLPPLETKEPEGFVKDSRWVIFPRLAYLSHLEIEKQLADMGAALAGYHGFSLTGGGRRGIAAGGAGYAYTREALDALGMDCRLFKVGAWPLPPELARRFLDGLDQVLVVEELDPVIERALLQMCGQYGISVSIRGKLSGDMPAAGEYSATLVTRAIHGFLDERGCYAEPAPPETPPQLPARPPTLCAGCPHRASFLAVKESCKGRDAVFTGDIGCYTLGNALPLDMVDTCLCMGAGVTVAQGLGLLAPGTVHFAFIGDSTFFHSGITGVVNALYNRHDMVLAVLDNGTTAMTGNQPHPGTGKTMSRAREPLPGMSIYNVLKGLGVEQIERVNPLDYLAARAAVRSALDGKGVRAILFEAPCAGPYKRPVPLRVGDNCNGCGVCDRKLGCPALSLAPGEKAAVIDEAACAGCGLCAQVCPRSAILSAGTFEDGREGTEGGDPA